MGPGSRVSTSSRALFEAHLPRLPRPIAPPFSLSLFIVTPFPRLTCPCPLSRSYALSCDLRSGLCSVLTSTLGVVRRKWGVRSGRHRRALLVDRERAIDLAEATEEGGHEVDVVLDVGDAGRLADGVHAELGEATKRGVGRRLVSDLRDSRKGARHRRTCRPRGRRCSGRDRQSSRMRSGIQIAHSVSLGSGFLQEGASTETHVVPDLEFLYGHACDMREPSQDERRCRVGRVTLVSVRLQRRKR